MKNIKKIAEDIFDTWTGPSGLCWSDEKQKFVNPEDDPDDDCEAIDINNDHPPKYLRPKDISW